MPLTGDLNLKSQPLLLANVPRDELRYDVAKACHHGSADVSWTFIEATAPVATTVSSGYNESYAHPRATVLGLTGASVADGPGADTRRSSAWRTTATSPR